MANAMKNILETALAIISLLSAALLAFAVGRASREAPAQYASGDLLSVFFQDARQVIGKSLVTRADSYYHGGVVMECNDMEHDHADDAHEHEGEPAHGDGGHEDVARQSTMRDPWAWMNSRLHIQAHRHLEGKDVEEIIPWIWAACRASPNNTEAYGMGWYVLAKMRKDVDAGIAVLEEGIRNNPDSLDLAFTLGQSIYSDRKDVQAAEAAFLETRTKALRKCGGDPAKLAEEDARIFVNALAYLAEMSNDRGEIGKVRTYCAEAEAAAPDYAATQGIRALLGK